MGQIEEAPENMEEPEAPEMDENLQTVLVTALNEAKRVFLANGGALVPFTALASEGRLDFTSHAAGEVDNCFAEAERCVASSQGKEAYAFCYDGYVETDDGTKDVIIAEGGVPGAEDGYAVGYLYTVDDEGGYTFEEEAAYIGEAPNFMAKLKSGVDYGEDEIDEKYLTEVDEDPSTGIDADGE